MSLKFSVEPIYENPPMRMKNCRRGAMLYNVNDLYIGRSYDLYGESAESEMSLMAKFVKPGQFVVDVGANIGAHTLCLAQTVGPEGRARPPCCFRITLVRAISAACR
jgi:hypothetical protein